MKAPTTNPRPLLINGEWLNGEGGTLASQNPATGEFNHDISCASAGDVDRAVASAHAAAAAPSWVGLLPHQRAAILHRIGDGLLANLEHFAHLQMIENGKVMSECVAQAKSAAATFRYYASVCETLTDDVTPARGQYLSLSTHEPYGVVAAITPWNSPMTMEAQKVAPALAAGNAIILKPAEITSSTALELGRVALAAGLPAGLLNVLPGSGHSTGLALVEHPGVNMISFTGGTETGKRIAQSAAARLIPVALELGGKSPHIVFDDADVASAVQSVAGGIFEGSGQSCVAGSRLFVQRGVYKRFVEALVEVARSIKVALPDAAGAGMGPIASFAHRGKIESMVQQARAEGADILAGGGRPGTSDLAKGAFYLPTLIAGIDNTATIAQQEIFGPVLCILPFNDEEDLVEQANDTVYGLAAGIWTGDFTRAWRVARRLKAGTVWINTYKQLSISTAFGGYKNSGLGREKGTGGLRLYQQAKSLYFSLG
jgi:betaine-aldehyde dehydrogenase